MCLRPISNMRVASQNNCETQSTYAIASIQMRPNEVMRNSQSSREAQNRLAYSFLGDRMKRVRVSDVSGWLVWVTETLLRHGVDEDFVVEVVREEVKTVERRSLGED